MASLAELQAIADRNARRYGLAPNLVRAVILKESGWKPDAVGDGGKSFGLMQLHAGGARATWESLPSNQGKRFDYMDPEVNTRVGCWFLGVHIPFLLGKYKKPDTVENRLIAYNAGIGRVISGQVPASTREYVAFIERQGIRVRPSGGDFFSRPKVAAENEHAPKGGWASIVWPLAKVVAAPIALYTLVRSIRGG